MSKIKKILKGIGGFTLGAVIGFLLYLFIGFRIMLYAVADDVGLGIIAIAPVFLILFGTLSAIVGGILMLILLWKWILK